MGNCFVTTTHVVHPPDHHQVSCQRGRGLLHQAPRSSTRIKVRMTTTQLKELMAQVDDRSKADSEVGRLILQQCFQGACHARACVVPTSHQTRLGTIIEEECCSF
ncbi:hypothetical protein L1049_013158 [Liquidambar formosana]|uniref:Uncharacterized protein n=1 Tax=Liquidambar formosana TaxID=63359 RepID=A0AAP0RK42_LIQFO